MTFQQLTTLQDVIRKALDTHVSTPEAVNWIRSHYRRIVDENWETISYTGLSVLVRAMRKTARQNNGDEFNSVSLCLDFGLSPMPLDEEISVPRDVDNIINSMCDWRAVDAASLADVEKHIQLLLATAAATNLQAKHWQIFLQAAMLYNPDPANLNITIGQLRKIARRRGK